MKKGVKVTSVGHFVPEKIVTNTDIINKGIDSSDKWIVSRTGIQERRIAKKNETTTQLALNASKLAFKKNNFPKSKLDLIIVATSTPEYNGFPSTATMIQEKIGAPTTCTSFDISAACTGFSYALTTACQYIQNNHINYALIIAADCLSKITNWNDRNTCILFGDGAGAVLLSTSSKNYVLASKLYSDGSFHNILKVTNFIEMEGQAVFKVATSKIITAIDNFLTENNLCTSDITYFIPHQANIRIIKLIQEKISFTDQQTIINIEKYGNTSAASIPIALSELYQKNKLKAGDLILTAGFGAGFTWGINLIKWSKI